MSNEAKFTPGPWVSDKDNANWGLFAKDGPIITAHYTSCVEVHNHFDMSLIAAAPELYECLEWIIKNYPQRGPDSYPNLDWLEKSTSALAKARGES